MDAVTELVVVPGGGTGSGGPGTGRCAPLLAALRAAPPGSALGGWSALAFDGLPEGFGAPVQLVIPAHARRPRLRGVRIAWSTQLGERWVEPDASPRRTVPARSLVDAAAWAPGSAVARDVVLRGFARGVARPEEVAAVLRVRGPCRHRGVIADVLGAAARGALPPPVPPLATPGRAVRGAVVAMGE